jgi:hypothetical protein
MEEQNGTAADAAIATLFCSGLIARLYILGLLKLLQKMENSPGWR